MHEHEVDIMPNTIFEPERVNEVVCVTDEGLGFGEGSISVHKRIELGELTSGEILLAREVIQDDPEVFVPVDADAPDDGCGDGRKAAYIYRMNMETGEIEKFSKSRRRAKLFGGGLIVASSMWRAVSGPSLNQETVLGDREYIAGELKEMGITYGAHTDNHAEGDNCGCGAIDKYPKITENIIKYRQEIETTLKVLYGGSLDDNKAAIDSVFNTYETLLADNIYFSNAAGSKTMELIEEKGAVIKELSNDHLEGFVVLNDIDNTTLDQRVLDDKLAEKGIQSEVQAFVVDTWRGRMYADAIAKIATRSNPEMNFNTVRATAYADFLIRTLAVSSTLTAGDQPVLVRMREGKSDFALAA
jgi:hypothetical protein